MLLALLGCLLGLTALAGAALRVHRRRRAALVAFAVEHGWQPVRLRPPRDLPLGRGARRTRGALAGCWDGRPVRAYEVVVSRATGAEPQVLRWSVLELDLAARGPDLDLVPLDPLTRAAARLLPPGLELESEDLSRRYRVTTGDRRAATGVLSARAVAALLAAEPVRVRVRGDRLVCWAPGRLEPRALAARLATVTALADGARTSVRSA